MFDKNKNMISKDVKNISNNLYVQINESKYKNLYDSYLSE